MDLTVSAGWFARGLAILLSLLNIKLLLNLIGVDGLAVHSIIFSLSTWLALLNLGIPAAVQNLVSKHRAKNEIYEQLKSTSFTLIVVIFVVLLPIVLMIGIAIKHWLLDSYQFLDTLTFLVACVFIFIAGLSQLFNAILYAEQRGIWPNIYPAINAIGVSIILLILEMLNISNFNIVLIFFLLPNFILSIVSAFQSNSFRVLNLNITIINIILKDSKGFSLFAALSACTLAVDYFIMSQTLQVKEIAQYNISNRVFMTILTIHAILLATKWPYISELIYSEQLQKARITVRSLLKQGLVLGALSGAIIIFSIDWIFFALAGEKIKSITIFSSILWLIYILIRIWSDTFAMSLLSTGKTKLFNAYIPIQALISIVGQYYLGSKFGLPGIVTGLIISFLMTAAWILPKEFFKISK